MPPSSWVLLAMVLGGKNRSGSTDLKPRTAPKSSLNTSYGIFPQVIPIFASGDHVLSIVGIVTKPYPNHVIHLVTFIRNGYAESSLAKPLNRNRPAILPGITVHFGHPSNASWKSTETSSQRPVPEVKDVTPGDLCRTVPHISTAQPLPGTAASLNPVGKTWKIMTHRQRITSNYLFPRHRFAYPYVFHRYLQRASQFIPASISSINQSRFLKFFQPQEIKSFLSGCRLGELSSQGPGCQSFQYRVHSISCSLPGQGLRTLQLQVYFMFFPPLLNGISLRQLLHTLSSFHYHLED